MVGASTAVEGLLARETDTETETQARPAETLQDTAHRLAEDLAQAISSRVTGMVGEEREGTGPAQYSFTGSAGGLLSSLQDLLPGTQTAPTNVTSSGPPSSGSSPPTSLSSVLHSLHSTYQATTGDTGAPSFQFSTPPPPFPTIPMLEPPTPAPLP